jgi:hypothetical protein
LNTSGNAPTWQSGGRIDAGGLSVVFDWQGDRFAHRVLLNERLALSSVEGQPEEAWPASPPAQSLMIDQNAAGLPRAMLVGMAGAGHWSASIEAVADGGILFDLACRLRGPAARRASTYALASGWEATPDEVRPGVWAVSGDAGRMEIELTGCRGEAGARFAMTLEEEAAPKGSAARTLRWCYRLREAARNV